MRASKGRGSSPLIKSNRRLLQTVWECNYAPLVLLQFPYSGDCTLVLTWGEE